MKALLERHPDKLLILSSLALMMLGMIVIYSSSGPYCQFLNPPKPTHYFLMRQSIWALAGLIGMYIAYRLNYHVFVKLSPLFVTFSILALVAVFPLSKTAVKRWISVGGFTVQPSEFFKIALVAFMARIAARSIGQEFSHRHYIPFLASMALGAALILREPDLGTTALVMGVAISLLLLSDFPKKYIFLIGLIFTVLAAVLVFGLGYEVDRVRQYAVTLENPFDSTASYQTRQSLVSLGSGGIVGKGLGYGGQKHLFLPARHTDFILSAAAEEGGFVIVMVILALFWMIGWSGYRIAKSAIDIEGSVFAWGILLLIMLQAMINIGVAMGVFPITGMTLPFLSYGGSSLLVCSAGVGMIASVARQSRLPRHYFRRLRT